MSENEQIPPASGEKGGGGGGPPPWINPEIQQKIAWREGDVVVSVPGKSGTTWTMNIVHQLRSGGDRNLEDVYVEVPWIEAVTAPGKTCEDMVAEIDSMPDNRPRAFKTHAWPPTLPFRDDVKYVVVCRNPEEAVVSMRPFVANHADEFLTLWGIPPERFRESTSNFDTFYDIFVKTMHWEGSLYGFVAGWWELRDRPNVLMVHYTDMVRDHEGSIRKISDFLGYGPYDDEQWRTILECTSYRWMKKHESKFECPTIWPVPVLKRGSMIRQGSFGLARQDGMTEDHAKDMADRGRKILTDEAAFEWFYKGGDLP